MSLKLRYASFLLLILALLALFGAATVYCLQKGDYLVTGGLLVLLYLITFQLGRRFSKIFLTLSFLRMLKQHNGVVNTEQYSLFIEKALAGRRTTDEKQKVTSEILEMLVKEGVVTIQDSCVLLNNQ